ncbi:MAG: hypothetical protein M3Q98_17390 [Actinomycetota bacterium]|nr:hypothetical protein [Actinomycetota bacterium]
MVIENRGRRLVFPVVVLLALMGSDNPQGGIGDHGKPAPFVLVVEAGDVELLYPGRARAVPLQIGNPFDFDVVVNTIAVTSSGTPRCRARFLELHTYRVNGPMIRAKSTARTSTSITLTDSAPGSCQGDRFAIRVTVEVGRV